MIGISPERQLDAELAVEHLTKAGDDARAMNALGVLYYRAPDVFENDPVKL